MTPLQHHSCAINKKSAGVLMFQQVPADEAGLAHKESTSTPYSTKINLWSPEIWTYEKKFSDFFCLSIKMLFSRTDNHFQPGNHSEFSIFKDFQDPCKSWRNVIVHKLKVDKFFKEIQHLVLVCAKLTNQTEKKN